MKIDNEIEYLNNLIKDIPDFPKKGIIFKDISFLIADNKATKITVDKIYNKIKDRDIDIVLGLDARGFLLGVLLAQKLGVGFAMARKKGKAPYHYTYQKYELEYGNDTVGISPLIIKDKMKVHIHDDLLATGGSIKNVISLIKKMGGYVDSTSFIIELTKLKGREKIKTKVFSILKY